MTERSTTRQSTFGLRSAIEVSSRSKVGASRWLVPPSDQGDNPGLSDDRYLWFLASLSPFVPFQLCTVAGYQKGNLGSLLHWCLKREAPSFPLVQPGAPRQSPLPPWPLLFTAERSRFQRLPGPEPSLVKLVRSASTTTGSLHHSAPAPGRILRPRGPASPFRAEFDKPSGLRLFPGSCPINHPPAHVGVTIQLQPALGCRKRSLWNSNVHFSASFRSSSPRVDFASGIIRCRHPELVDTTEATITSNMFPCN